MESGLKKILAVAVVMLMLSVGVVVGEANNNDTETNTNPLCAISRVNTVGSSVFVADSYLTEKGLAPGISLEGIFFEMRDGVAHGINQEKYWDGMVVGTPGKPTIQHKMIEAFVKDMGMDFAMYVQGADKAPNTVFYDTTLQNAGVWVDSKYMDAGTVWHPVCGAIEAMDGERGATRIMSSAQMQPNHACCVIGANSKFIQDNRDTAVQYLAAFIMSVDLVNECIKLFVTEADEHTDAERAEYQTYFDDLMDVAVKTTKQSESIIKTAFSEVHYTYGNMKDTIDTPDRPLLSLKKDVYNLASAFASDGTFGRSIDSLGFKDMDDYANKFIDDSVLAEALALADEVRKDTSVLDRFKNSMSDIKVAAIAGDVHQVALHYGKMLGIFEKFGVNVIVQPSPNGGGVATSIQNGAADVGFLGLPPLTLIGVNSGLVINTDADIVGKVTNANGDALNNAEIVFTPYDSYSGVARTPVKVMTDENGIYIMKLPVGSVGVLSYGDWSMDIDRFGGSMTINISLPAEA